MTFIIPGFGEAGNMFNTAFFPVCIPTPQKDIFFDIVFWVSIDTHYLYKKYLRLNTQEILQENTITYWNN